MPMVIVFDVNGTLLDTEALARPIRGIFGRKLSADAWFTKVLQHSMALTLAGDYREFGDIAISVLEMAAAAEGISPNKTDIEKVRSAMEHLRPFPEIKASLRKLRKANFRLATLTNGAPANQEAQLRNAGLYDYFERTLSVDTVRRYKPAIEPYQFAAQSLGVDPRNMLMVAAHHWDLLGAARAGCRTAFLSRPGKALLPGARSPEYVAKNLSDLADQLLSETRVRPRAKHRPSANRLALVTACGAAVALAGSLLTRRKG